MRSWQNSPAETSLGAENLEGYILKRGRPPALFRILRVWGVEVVPGLQAGEGHNLATASAPNAQSVSLQESSDMPSDNGHLNGAAEELNQTTAQVEKARRKFGVAQEYFRSKDYRKAIVVFERVRQMTGLPQKAYLACLFNIGQANIKLRRFATAILYFETYLKSSEISEKDRSRVQSLLEDARRGAGIGG
jgi:tetratricopeptide (TPR) repeat protein